MKIDKTNGSIINTREVYIHDDVLNEFFFDRAEKQLHLVLLKARNNHRICIDFYNVIGFKMTSCDFWGGSPYIFDFEYVEEKDRTIVPELFGRKEMYNDPVCILEAPENYIETKMTFVSGDYLVVACKSIIM